MFLVIKILSKPARPGYHLLITFLERVAEIARKTVQ